MARSSLVLTPLCAATFAVACSLGGPRDREPTATPSPIGAPPKVAPLHTRGRIALVLRDPAGVLHTAILHADPGEHGAEERRPGALLFAEGKLWTWVTTERLRALPGCDGDGEPPHPGRTERVELVATDGAVRTLVAASDLSEPPVRAHVDRVSLVGIVGPYLVARRRIETDACGAHGTRTTESLTLDLRTGEVRPMLAAPSDLGLRDMLERARKTLRETGSPDELPSLDDGITLRAIEPKYELGVGTRFEHVFTAEACYACGDGEWEDYTRATRILARQAPGALSAHAAPNAAVDAYARRHAEFEIVGFSVE